jgi:hypothetical protein
MKTRIGLLLLPLVALAACVDNNASIEIATICAAPDDATECAFSSSQCGQTWIGQTTLDISVSSSLWIMLQVNNQLPNNESLDENRLNTNDAWVHGYVVEFDIGLPDVEATILGAAWVPAENSTVVSLEPIDETAAAALSIIPLGGGVDIVAHLRLRGVYGDTTEFETGEFDIPIRVCNGCMGVPACATAGDVRFFCPKAGQLPASSECVTP